MKTNPHDDHSWTEAAELALAVLRNAVTVRDPERYEVGLGGYGLACKMMGVTEERLAHQLGMDDNT